MFWEFHDLFEPREQSAHFAGLNNHHQPWNRHRTDLLQRGHSSFANLVLAVD